MKTRLFTLLFVLTSAVAMYAQKSNILEKKSYHSSGYTKEIILMDRDRLTPLKKVVYNYTTQGYLTERVVYGYNWRRIAVALCKVECNYDEKNNPASLIFTKWDKNAGQWSDKSEQTAYYYNAKGDVMAMKPEGEMLPEDFLTVKE